MANALTLDDIRRAANERYDSFPVQIDEDTTVTLVNPLRMSKKDRKELTALMNGLEDAEDQEAAVDELIVQIAESKAAGRKLLAALGDDLAAKMYVIEEYSKSTQAGEA